MKLSIPVMAFLLLCSHIGLSQKLKFKEKTIVHIATAANKKFPVLFTDAKKLKKTNAVFNMKGDTISYHKTEITDWSKSDTLDKTVASKYGISDYSLDAEVKPESDKLVVYFYPFYDTCALKKANTFFEENTFCIKLAPRQNLGFPYHRIHAGVMTLPLKVYVSSRADENNNNVESDVNVGLYIGRLMGTKRYVKMPSEEAFRMYEYGWSINFMVGFNKLEIDADNSLDPDSFTGTVVTSSPGVSIGWHYKTFSIFGALGTDIPLSEGGKDWYFKNQLWIGFGAGFDVF